MSKSIFINAEEQIRNDSDGSYRAQLIKELEKYRDAYACAKQNLLPPNEYEIVVAMEAAINAAINIIEDYKPEENSTSADEENLVNCTMNAMTNA